MKIILFRGRPGTGKTLLSGLLAERLNIVVLRKDDIYDSITFLNAEHRLRNKATYDVLYTILKSNAGNASKIILDFPFQFDEDIDQLMVWCHAHKVELKSILVTCSDEVLWAGRFNERAENPSPNQLITDFEQLRARYTTMQIEARTCELLIDTVNSVGENIAAVVNFVD
jgi:predicted kinase